MYKQCKYCSKDFHAKRKWQTYCSDACRVGDFYLRKATKLLENKEEPK